MKISKIKIKNFKSFEEVEFNLNTQFTVFIGDNAKGKTSVLDALAIAVGGYLRGIDVASHEARGILKKEIRVRMIEGRPRPQIPVVIEAFGDVAGLEIQGGWKRTLEKLSKKTTTTYVKAKNISDIATKMLTEGRSSGNITLPVIAYHGTGRLWTEHETKKAAYKKEGEGIERAYLHCLSPKSSSKEFLSWYKTHEDEVKKFNNLQDKILLEAFNSAIISMIPDDRWTDISYSFKEEDLIGIFKTNGNSNKLLFSQLSDGYRNLIGMVADIAHRCIKLNPHLGSEAISKTPGIVLIDELDLHLHPNWQKRIVSDLKKTFPQIQFVTTTHSPFIVQSLSSEELVNLDEVKGLDDDPMKYSVEDIAESAMGVENVSRSNEFLEMVDRAKEYYQLIKKGASKEELNRAKQLLDELQKKYSNDPAYVALLKTEYPIN